MRVSRVCVLVFTITNSEMHASGRFRATLSLFKKAQSMSTTADHWRLDTVAHTDRLIGVAMKHLNDANEARWLVHRVMMRTMTDMLAPTNRRDLDTALTRALRTRPEKTA